MRALRERADDVFVYGFHFAWVCGMLSLLGGALLGGDDRPLPGLLLVAGIVLAVLGGLAAGNWADIRQRLTDRWRDSWQWRMMGQARYTRFEAVLLLVIGLCWTGLGAATTF